MTDDSHKADINQKNMNIVKKTITMGDGTIVEIETGKLAKQADGSVVVKVGGTMLLATVTDRKSVV